MHVIFVAVHILKYCTALINTGPSFSKKHLRLLTKLSIDFHKALVFKNGKSDTASLIDIR